MLNYKKKMKIKMVLKYHQHQRRIWLVNNSKIVGCMRISENLTFSTKSYSFQIYTCICRIIWKILKKEMCLFLISSCTSHTLFVLYNLMKTHSKVFLKYIPIPVGTEHTPFWNKRHNVINSICDFCQKVSYLIYVYIYIYI